MNFNTMNPFTKLIICLALLGCRNAAIAQDLEMDSLETVYNRLNSGQAFSKDIQLTEQLKRFERDSVIIHRTFTGKNGKNQLEIKVVNPCCLDQDNYRVDGTINYISVKLTNKNYSDTLIYYNPDVQMSLIHLTESNITLKTIENKKVVLIPFNYCGNADDNILMSCIVFYDHKKYIYHINLRGENFANFKIVDNLNEKFESLPHKLKKELVKFIETQYQTIIWINLEQ